MMLNTDPPRQRPITPPIEAAIIEIEIKQSKFLKYRTQKSVPSEVCRSFYHNTLIISEINGDSAALN